MSAISAPNRRSAPSAGLGRVPVTYRHLLSPAAMTTSSPLRVIAHCDIDAAYAQFEMVRLNLPPDQPVCVQQWSGLIAVNYPARKYGITRHMDVHEARKKCPHLQTVHVATFKPGEVEPGYWGEVDSATHKVSLDPYRRESAKILAVFKEMVPEGDVEKASIDEAFLDLTALTVKGILERHPHLAQVPRDAPQGLDTPLPPPPPISWTKAGNVFPIRGEPKKAEEGGDVAASNEKGKDVKGDWAGTDEEGAEGVGGWEDYALCVGAEMMADIRREVHKRLGYTCSAGVGHNKTLAKLCSGWKKPDNQTIMRQAAVPAFLNPMPFTKIRFLGGKLGEAMASEYGANTVGDMLTVPLEEMQRKFGEESIWVWNILRGIDHTEVKERTAVKSMLASKNIQPSVTNRKDGYHWLNVLAGELYVRLRDAREITDGLWPKTLVLGTRQAFESQRSRQTAFPFTRHLSADYIARYAFKLWDEVTEPMMQTGPNAIKLKFNNLALGFHNLERLEGGQKGIEGFFGPGMGPTKIAKRERERSASAGPSGVAGAPAKKPRNGLLNTALKGFDADEAVAIVDDNPDEPSAYWKCQRCSFEVSIPLRIASDQEVVDAQLTAKRQEHEDYHFARDLHTEERATTASRPLAAASAADRSAQANKPGKKAKPPEGIKAFFTAKPKSGT